MHGRRLHILAVWVRIVCDFSESIEDTLPISCCTQVACRHIVSLNIRFQLTKKYKYILGIVHI
jgi:hypothetical protein